MPSEAALNVETEANLVTRMEEALAAADGGALKNCVLDMDGAELCHAFFRLDEADQSQFLVVAPVELSTRVLEHLPSVERVILLDRLEPDEAVRAMSGLQVCDQAGIIDEISDNDGEMFYKAMPDAVEQEVRAIISYEEGTAGRLMQPKPTFLLDTLTIGEAVQLIATSEDLALELDGERPIIASAEGLYRGVLPLRAMLSANRARSLSRVADELEPLRDLADLDEVRDWFEWYDEARAPIVDGHGKLVGILDYDTVADVMAERKETDAMKVRGVIGDELRSMPTLFRARRRLAWLSANIVLNIIAASVISAYEETLAAVIVLAVFLPMVSDMSGCSGNQAVAVSMREISLGLARPSDALRIWWKEVSVGLINGVALGIIIGLVAWIWKGIPVLGLVIGVALAINTLIAVSIGGVVPLLLKRFNVDPAVASGPLLTTITDMAGFFLVLGLATLFLPYLT